MPSLSTHVLDLHHGIPAQNVKIELFYQQENEPKELITTVITNSDGRCDEQMVTNENWRQGTYELVFHVSDYYKAKNVCLPTPNFLTTVPVRFNMTESPSHYHVPLLVTPWGYQVYRGS
ncbi:hydroxyisourate hydrolase [Lysinibacillus sp. SGAir0095]|uniref:hydroxyisourate hydrolase n=1 Tax=Lysinibacillus sp. SGAir0095 TaxID=2070463 RepID=UPI0010CD203C|nr:hydroxyisourate hydrolase [Lysinibacillus sp. SGAir0095]QCR30981.1 hydroxyisourate hydrolase [Lysinibacillus sp. SGAir0095]